jgi:hypothetical protein
MRTYLTERFWSRVEPKESGCWEWTTRGPGGYGRFKAGGKNLLAHRVSWEINVGPIPDGLLVLHRCDNPPCIRPSHLFVGTQKDNLRDMQAKGRGLSQVHQKAIRHPTGDDHWTHKYASRVRRGEQHHNSKMTADQVRELRALSKDGWTLARLAERFGIRISTASYIVRRETWRDLD